MLETDKSFSANYLRAEIFFSKGRIRFKTTMNLLWCFIMHGGISFLENIHKNCVWICGWRCLSEGCATRRPETYKTVFVLHGQMLKRKVKVGGLSYLSMRRSFTLPMSFRTSAMSNGIFIPGRFGVLAFMF